MILQRLFRPKPVASRTLYEAIVAAARHPVFYARWGVADTLDGRFDMIVLHAFAVLERLKGEAPQLRQRLVDELFADMDRSLREMGVGDLSVGKKVRVMAEVFYGRVSAYEAALNGEPSGLDAALERNLFPDGAPDGAVERLAGYVRAMRAKLGATPPDLMAAGRVEFAEPLP